jgi:hypothetical protein
MVFQYFCPSLEWRELWEKGYPHIFDRFATVFQKRGFRELFWLLIVELAFKKRCFGWSVNISARHWSGENGERKATAAPPPAKHCSVFQKRDFTELLRLLIVVLALKKRCFGWSVNIL